MSVASACFCRFLPPNHAGTCKLWRVNFEYVSDRESNSSAQLSPTERHGGRRGVGGDEPHTHTHHVLTHSLISRTFATERRLTSCQVRSTYLTPTCCTYRTVPYHRPSHPVSFDPSKSSIDSNTYSRQTGSSHPIAKQRLSVTSIRYHRTQRCSSKGARYCFVYTQLERKYDFRDSTGAF